jgi:predicted CoA-binding protein
VTRREPEHSEAIAMLRRVLQHCRTVAVVGASTDGSRPSNGVAKYLLEHGYTVIPVNPRYDEVLGLTCYPDLRSVPVRVDMVDVFRKPADAPAVAREAIAIGAKVLWLQLGVISEEARDIAEAAGMAVVMDRCVKIEHARLL